MTSQIILGNYAGIVVASDTAMTKRVTTAVTHGHQKMFEQCDPIQRMTEIVQLGRVIRQNILPRLDVPLGIARSER